MKRAIELIKELEDAGAATLAGISPEMPYALPLNYFAHLSDSISARISFENEEDVMPDFGKAMPFASPSPAYFEGLAERIIAAAKETEEVHFGKAMPFSVPPAYFEGLQQNVMAQIKAEQKPAVKVTRRIPLLRNVRIAASIALILFVGFGLLKMGGAEAGQADLNKVSKADISAYVNANLDDFDTDLIINGLAQSESQGKQSFKLSDDEIKAYLDETGWN